jgi:hypothetical protein
MSNRPKSISIQQLSSAVQNALGKVKTPQPPENGPWLVINPGVICGLVFAGPSVEAEALASSIAKEVSVHAGMPLSGLVQESSAGPQAAAAIIHRPVVLGYKADVQIRA